MKAFLIQLRNRLAPSNLRRLRAGGRCQVAGNLLATTIDVQGDSVVRVAEGARLRDARIRIRGAGNVVEIEQGVFFSGRMELIGDGNTVRIGERTRINGADFIVHDGTSITIGSDCLFAKKIDLRTTDSHSIYGPDGDLLNADQDIVIEDHVWVGRMVSIVKGARIGSGSVIGAMALVAGVVPASVVAAGVPAKPVRHNITWDRRSPAASAALQAT